ncbi:hypothetical protein D3C83_181510 [compost metagenome]
MQSHTAENQKNERRCDFTGKLEQWSEMPQVVGKTCQENNDEPGQKNFHDRIAG